MSQGNGLKVTDARRLSVERVSANPYFNRSARIRDLLHYLTTRVVAEEACEIREHEVGHRVFGRSRDYDTTADKLGPGGLISETLIRLTGRSSLPPDASIVFCRSLRVK